MRDEIVLAGSGFVPIRRRDVGYFEFEGRMRDDIVQNVEQALHVTRQIFVYLQF